MQDAKAKNSKQVAEPEDVSTSTVSKAAPPRAEFIREKSPKLDEDNAKSIRVAMRNQLKGNLAPMGPAIPPNHPLCHPVNRPSDFWQTVSQPAKEPEQKEKKQDVGDAKRSYRKSRSDSVDSIEGRNILF
jgi:hypothetical protein